MYQPLRSIQQIILAALEGRSVQKTRHSFALSLVQPLTRLEVPPQGTPIQAAVRFRGRNPEITRLAKNWAVSNDRLAWTYCQGSSFVVINETDATNLYNDYHGVFLNALAAAQANGDDPQWIKLAFGRISIPESMVKTMAHALTVRMDRVNFRLAPKEEPFTHEFADFLVNYEKSAA